MKTKPMIVIRVRGGVVQEVNTATPVTVFVEDWDCSRDQPLFLECNPNPLTEDQVRRIATPVAEIQHAEKE